MSASKGLRTTPKTLLSGCCWLREAEKDAKEHERRAKSEHLEPVDESGRVLDFHCLRHTYITRLAKSGVHPKTAQARARHSTITLTMDAYTHSLRSDERSALDLLPAVVKPDRPERQEARPTGTDDAAAQITNDSSTMVARRAPEGSNACKSLQFPAVRMEAGKTDVNLGTEGLIQGHPTPCEGSIRQAAVGFEPTNNGFAIRRLEPLGYAANYISTKHLGVSHA